MGGWSISNGSKIATHTQQGHEYGLYGELGNKRIEGHLCSWWSGEYPRRWDLTLFHLLWIDQWSQAICNHQKQGRMSSCSKPTEVILCQRALWNYWRRFLAVLDGSCWLSEVDILPLDSKQRKEFCLVVSVRASENLYRVKPWSRTVDGTHRIWYERRLEDLTSFPHTRGFLGYAEPDVGEPEGLFFPSALSYKYEASTLLCHTP